jgi:glycosyltransferase involved in cell wall biosynthesis
MMPLGKVWELFRRWSYPLLDGLVAQTEASCKWLKRHAPSKRIVVIPNPVCYPLGRNEPEVLPENVLLDATRATRVLLAVGRLGDEKGFDRLLKAFESVRARHPEWVLIIIGEGKLRADLSAQAEALRIQSKVRFPGAVGNIGDWFEAADAYILTSRFEGFPNTLLEALAYGVPAIAVDCETGPSEILRNEVDGLLVPQDDSGALSTALCRLMGDDALRERFAYRAVEARDRFGIERVADQWEQLFTSVLEKRR